jgi:hypothetical protein
MSDNDNTLNTTTNNTQENAPTINLDDGHTLTETTVIDFNTDGLQNAYKDYEQSGPIDVDEKDKDEAEAEDRAEDDEALPPLPPAPLLLPSSTSSSLTLTKEETNNVVNIDEIPVPELTEVPVEEVSSEDKNKKANYITENFEASYTRLVDLVQGTTYDLTNWTLLIVKVLKCVSFVKDLSAEQQIDLAIEIIIFYLDNNTEIQDEELVFIKTQAEQLCWTIFEEQGVHKKAHKKNNKNTLKIQKRVDANSKKTDIDVLASPLQVVNTVINKVEVIIKSRSLTPETLMQTLPSIIISVVGMVDKYKHLTKSEKKNLIIQAVQTVIRERVPKLFNLDNSQKKALELFTVSLPQIVETSIGIANGDTDFHIDFNKPEEALKKAKGLIVLLAPLLKCLGKKK